MSYYDDLLKNVKESLIKAANEGKKKALNKVFPEVQKLYENIFDEAKIKFNEGLKEICGVSDESSMNSSEDDASIEKIKEENKK